MSINTSGQPYSAYAVHLTTLSPPAFIGDGALVWLLWKAGQTWPEEQRHVAIYTLLVWMFISKFSKNLGHYIRYPSDVALLPVSIAFGWFHGLIKFYAMVTLDVVSVSLHGALFHNLVLSSTTAVVPSTPYPYCDSTAFTWQNSRFTPCTCHY